MGACSTKLSLSPEWEVDLAIKRNSQQTDKLTQELLDKTVHLNQYDKKSQKIIARQINQYTIDTKALAVSNDPPRLERMNSQE